MKTALNKVWRDLLRNKGRTLLVVMSIAVGVMAVGMIITSNTLITRQLKVSHAGFQPSHAQVFLQGVVDDATVESLARIEGIESIEGRLTASVRWKTSPDGEWQDGSLRALTDYEQQNFDLIELRSGAWPARGTVDAAFNHVDAFGIPATGNLIFFEVNNRPKAFEMGGTIRDAFQLSFPFVQNPTFYVTAEEFAKITGFSLYSELRYTVPEYSEENVMAMADEIERVLRRQNIEVGFVQAFDPNEHFAQTTMDGIGLILTIMAIAALGLSTFLIINTMNALMVQQIPQVGMMKIVGGLSGQIATLYLAGVAVYGLLSLVIAIPAGAFAGDALSRWLLTVLNVTTSPFELLYDAFVVQIAVGLLVPLLAALWPVLRGVAIPVARALSSYGLGQGQYGTRFLDRILGNIRGIPRLAALILRNTFRRPGRVAMTQITLIIAGAIFMMVLSTSQSFNETINKIFAGFGFDVFVVFQQPQRIDEIIPLVESRPNVDRAEIWQFGSGYTRPIAASEEVEYEIVLRGIPADTELFTPELVAGRNLHPDDGHALLLNQKLAGDMGVGVGDQIILNLENYGESTWTVVGLILDLAAGPDQNSAYMHRDTLSAETNSLGRGGVVEIRAVDPSLATQVAIKKDVTDFFTAKGIGIGFSMTAAENKEQANAQFNIITTILLIMTVLIAAVGSFGLSGTLSINVYERRREIGVMRAVGASSWDVGRVFMGEGLMLGIISWLIAIPLSMLGGKLFVDTLGTVLEFPFTYVYSTQSVWLWFGIVVVLSIIASWVPARGATRISVRESLAYE
ncbi:MAG: FtsX-like permease family protein [Anaerolineales bacterium]